MAIDALAVPFDITWTRLGYMPDMIERGFHGGPPAPPRWRSSATIYGYLVPDGETGDDYPDHRVVYLKISTSITGWSPRETLPGLFKVKDDEPWSPDGNEGDPGGGSGDGGGPDEQADGAVSGSPALGRAYWPCVAAVLQVAIYPRPDAEVPDDAYPYISDFEPKKRELYETVTATNEVLSGSQHGTNVRKGSTTTKSTEVSVHGGLSDVVGTVTGISVGGSVTRRTGSEEVDVTTTDASTERRETQGRSTQLSQMYQLWNGYHLGTNRAVFAMFPRPHIVSESAQIENSLIQGERRLEGVQDVFLVVMVPRGNPGLCVRAVLDLSHKTDGTVRLGQPYTSSRRAVDGCGTFEVDRLVAVPREPAPAPPPHTIEIVAEGLVPSITKGDRQRMKTNRKGRVEAADSYNLAKAELQRAVLGHAASVAYQPRPFVETRTFYRLAALELMKTTATLASLEAAGYATADERKALEAAKLQHMGALFDDSKPLPAVAITVRGRIWQALMARAIKTE